MKKYLINTIHVAQIGADDLHPRILKELEERASFRDTDDTLNECLTSVDVLDNLVTEWEGLDNDDTNLLIAEVVNLANQLLLFNYIQIVKI